MSDELAWLKSWFEYGVAQGVGRELTMGVFDLMHHDPSSFTRTTPPMDELLVADGYVDRRGWWGPADREWQTPGEKSRAVRVEVAAARYGLQHHAQEALARLNDVWLTWSAFHNFDHGDPPQLDVGEMLKLFEIELVPLAFFDMHGAESVLMAGNWRKDRRRGGSALRLLADEVSRAAPDSIAALLLTGWNHELEGRARAALLHP